MLPLRGNHTNLAARLIQFNQTKAQFPRYELKERPSGLPNRMEDNLLLFEYCSATLYLKPYLGRYFVSKYSYSSDYS